MSSDDSVAGLLITVERRSHVPAFPSRITHIHTAARLLNEFSQSGLNQLGHDETHRTDSLSAIAERNPSYATTAYIKKNRDGKAVSLCRSFTMDYYGDRIDGLVYRRSYNGNYVYIFS